MKTDDEFLIGRLDSAEAQASAFGDVIDVKASVVLVVLTFLGQLLSSLSGADAGGVVKGLVFGSAVATTISGLLALVELWPRKHALEAAEGLHGWMQELRAYYANHEDAEAKVHEQIVANQIQRTGERLALQQGINATKSALLGWSFGAMGVAVATCLAALAWTVAV